ncbi:MAG: hypothetical protein RIT81_46815 [Deltaproteobacteria bacterium]
MLGAFGRGPEQSSYEDTRHLESSGSWSADVLLARLLLSARWDPPSQARVAEELGEETSILLGEVGLTEVVFERVRMTRRAYRCAADKGKADVGLGDLARRFDQFNRHFERGPNIQEANACRIHAEHVRVFPATPAFDALRQDGAFVPVDGQLAINLGARPWQHVVAPAAARLWPQLEDEAPRARLRRWLDVVGSSHAWGAAPLMMLPSDRDAWLEVATTVVRAHDVPPGHAPHDVPAVALSRRYEQAEREQRYAVEDPFDVRGTREEVRALATAIVRCDPVWGTAYGKRGANTKQLLDEFTSPGLASVAAQVLLGSKPELLPSLLLDPVTNVFAMNLVLRILPDSGLRFGTWDEHFERARAQRRPAIEEAFAVFFEAIGANLPRTGVDEAATATLEVLGGLARRAVEVPIQHPTALAQQQDAREALAIGLGRLRSADVPTRISAGVPYSPTLVSAVGPSIVRDAERFSDDRASAAFMVPAVPTATVLFVLLDEASNAAARPYRPDAPLARAAVARALVKVHRRSLGSALNDAPDSSDHADYAAMGWDEVASTLGDTDALAQLLTHDAVTEALGVIGAPGTDAPRRRARGARLQLRVLLRIHEGLSARAALTGDDETVRVRVEAALAAILTAPGCAALLKRAPFSGDPFGLLDAVCDALNRMPPDVLDGLVPRWLGNIDDPVALLRVSNSIVSRRWANATKDRALSLLGAGTPTLANIATYPELLQLARSAAASNEAALAERVLVHGEDLGAVHALGAGWTEEAFRTRLLAAYQGRDLERMRSLPLPNVPENAADRLEATRSFYLALHRRDEDPAEAVDLLETLSKARPLDGPVLVQLFAARVRAAEKHSEAERDVAYREALELWEEVERSLPAAELQRVADEAERHRLAALHGARLDDEFDRRWKRLPDALRTDLKIATCAIRHFVRTDRLESARAVAALAWQANEGEAPDASTDLLREVETLAREPWAHAAAHVPFDGRPDALRRALLEIRDLGAEDLAQVISASSLRELLLGELYEAAKELLVRRELLHRRGAMGEDQYTDVVESLLRSRWAHFNLSIDGQARGGRSDGDTTSPGAGVGRRDLVVRVKGGEIAVIEALRLKTIDKGAIRKHLEKLDGYDPTANPHAFVLVYYVERSFDAFVGRYMEALPESETGGLILRDQTLRESAPAGASATSGRVVVVSADYDRSGRAVTIDHVLVDCDPSQVVEAP